jgi:putative membrane protein
MLTGDLMHFAVHTWLFAVSVLMWLPVFSPTPAVPRLSPPGQMFYLFAQSLLPTIPASFLTFSSVAIYPIYGDAALAFGLSAVADQTIAGVIMKLGGGLLLWSTIAVIWFRWTKQEREWEEMEASLRAS